MVTCLVAAAEADICESTARPFDVWFDRTPRVGFGELLVCIAREKPDLLVVAAELSASEGPGSVWASAVESVRQAMPGLPVLVAGPPEVARDVESRLVATAFELGVRGFLRSGSEVGPRPPHASHHVASAVLSPRELDVLLGMTDGLSNAEIAAALDLAQDTVKTHVRRLFRRLGAGDRADAVARGFRQGFLR